MRLESTRKLILPCSPEAAWRRLAIPRALPALMPELERASGGRDGSVRVVALIGGRRRSWSARVAICEPGRRWALRSESDEVAFRFEARFEPHPRGCAVLVDSMLEPPPEWLALRIARSRRSAIGAALLFVASATGLFLLPRLELSPAPEAVAFAVIGAFLLASALASGVEARRRSQPPAESVLARPVAPRNGRR